MQILRMGLCALLCAGYAAAQDKITVPLSSPGQAATVKIHLINGSITVTAGAAGQVAVETSTKSPNRAPRDIPPGMHRLDTDRMGIEAVEDHNVVSIGSGGLNDGSLAVQVPSNCSLQLRTVNGGHIDVTGITGEIEVSDTNGSINLKNVSGSIVASSQNGGVTAVVDRVTPDKPMSFTSLNGKVDVTLPADTKARLRLKTGNGSIYTNFDVKTEPDSSKPVVEDARGQGGKFRIRTDRNIYGVINGGGPEYRFETLNGDIVINKK